MSREITPVECVASLQRARHPELTPLDGKRILITGGTGSLGKMLVRRILSNAIGEPEKVTVFSRDEAKQYFMAVEHRRTSPAASHSKLEFRIGDIRDFASLSAVVRNADIVFNAAALKQVPSCEYFPFEAIQTNLAGPENLIRAIEAQKPGRVETVIGISTDKACKPVNVMGMTKALQERLFIQANMRIPSTRFVCVRYGNVLASRGSVIPLFHDQIRSGGPVTITTTDMTRFLLSLDHAVDTVFQALIDGKRGETYVPIVSSARVVDVARILIGDRKVEMRTVGIRPGEKVHEILVSEEEAARTTRRGEYYAMRSMLPELADSSDTRELQLASEYNSANSLMHVDELAKTLRSYRLMVEDVDTSTEMLA